MNTSEIIKIFLNIINISELSSLLIVIGIIALSALIINEITIHLKVITKSQQIFFRLCQAVIPLLAVLCLQLYFLSVHGQLSYVVDINLTLVLIFYFLKMLDEHFQVYLASLGAIGLYIFVNFIKSGPQYNLGVTFVALIITILSMCIIECHQLTNWHQKLVYLLALCLYPLSWWALMMPNPLKHLQLYFELNCNFAVYMLIIHIINSIVKQQQQHYHTLVDEANIDFVTGIENRFAFERNFGLLHEKFERENHDFSLLIMDIDNFKAFNDTYGHLTGDHVLRSVTNTIKQKFGLNHDFSIYRIGGEEFGILLRHTDIIMAQKIALDISNSIEHLKVMTKNGDLSVTISIGVGQFSALDTTKESFYDRVDYYLYMSKRHGKNTVTVNGNVY